MTATPRLDLRGLTGAQGKTGRDRPIATGLASARPAASLITPDSFYYATDTGVLSYSNGATWATVTAGSTALGAWQTYTPAWTGTGSNPAIGNGTITGRYIQAGKIVHGNVRIVMGSTTTFGSAGWIIGLPVAAQSAAVLSFLAHLKDASAGEHLGMVRGNTANDVIPFSISSAPMGLVTGAVPFAWTTSDEFVLNFTYEAA